MNIYINAYTQYKYTYTKMYSTNIYICQLMKFLFGIPRTYSEINSCWERVYMRLQQTKSKR